MRSEHVEQREFVQWFRRSFEGVRIFAIPNGGARRPSEAAKFKAEGVSKGVPDLYIPAWKLWIEMKKEKGGTVSKEQKNWKKYLEDIGDTVFICKGKEDAINQVNTFIK